MLPDLSAALRLQELDRRAAELTKEIAALPRHIAEIEKKLESHERKLAADHAALSANSKDRKKLEGDIQMHEQKISKLRDQMLQAKTNEQYRAFQHEIDYCQDEIRKAEDRILDLMAESEPLEANVKAAEGALKKERAEVEAEKKQAEARTEADRKELDWIQKERISAAAGISDPVYKAYERIRRSRGGHSLAEVVDGRCSVCQINVRPQFLQELRKGEKVMFCESCSRIAYYNPPTAVEDLTGPAAATTT